MMYQASRDLTKSLFRAPPDPRPWIIWVDRIGIGKLHLSVIKPRYNFALSYFSRWKMTTLVHSVGPLLFTTEEERVEISTDLTDIGIEHIPPNRTFEICYSLGDVAVVVGTKWRPKS